MKKAILTGMILCILGACGKVVLNDDLYIRISAEAICSSLDDDTPIYQKYGVTKTEMMQYKQWFSTDEQKRQEIAKKILEASATCLGNTNA